VNEYILYFRLTFELKLIKMKTIQCYLKTSLTLKKNQHNGIWRKKLYLLIFKI